METRCHVEFCVAGKKRKQLREVSAVSHEKLFEKRKISYEEAQWWRRWAISSRVWQGKERRNRRNIKEKFEFEKERRLEDVMKKGTDKVEETVSSCMPQGTEKRRGNRSSSVEKYES